MPNPCGIPEFLYQPIASTRSVLHSGVSGFKQSFHIATLRHVTDARERVSPNPLQFTVTY